MSTSTPRPSTPAPTTNDKAAPSIVPGLAVCGAAALVSVLANLAIPALSPLLVAILLGVAATNLAGLLSRSRRESGLPQALDPGLAVAARRLLRLGIVLLGLQLVLGEIAALGWLVVLGVVAIVGLGIASTLLMGRWLKVGPSQTLLIACGFSICGAAAVAGVDGVLAKRKGEETATAIALVVVFGTAMIAVVPALAAAFGLPEQVAGLWAGGSIHEVAQVVAAGGIIGAEALKIAVVVKLARVLMLAPVLAVVSWQQRRETPDVAGARRPPVVPLFVVGFAAMVALRSLGLVPEIVLTVAKVAETALLAAAMFALGCSAHVSVVRKAGARPVALAAAATAVVAALGLVMAKLAG